MADKIPILIKPQQGRQEQFLSSPADIVIYGGSAGGGKTWALLLDQLRDINTNGFNALILRRTYPEVTNQGGLWDESEKIYPLAGGTGVEGALAWKFPAGATVEFGHLNHEKDLSKYDGAQICSLAFDQLEHFTRKMFFYMLMRNRSVCGVPPRVRATCNPPDPADDGSDWLTNFLDYWIDQDGYANLNRAGHVRYMVQYNDEIIWSSDPEELLREYPGYFMLSVAFIPATVYDNKILLERDPNYIARLQALPYIERQRFLGDRERGGNWRVAAASGKVFNREWFDVVQYAPPGGVECAGWDFAATMRSVKNNDPDYTCRIKIRRLNGIYYVVDRVRDRFAAGEVDAVIHKITGDDLLIARNSSTAYRLRWETEPGSAAIRETERMKRELRKRYPGLNADGVSSMGDKIAKSRSFAVAAENGLVKVVAASWTDEYLNQLHGFPDKPHDDDIDASGVAFRGLEDTPETNSTTRRTVSAWERGSL